MSSSATFLDESTALIDSFLEGKDPDKKDAAATAAVVPQHLFVWLPIRAATATSGGSDTAEPKQELVAGMSLPKTPVASAIVFCRRPTSDAESAAADDDASRKVQQLQCMTLPSSVLTTTTDEESKEQDVTSTSTSVLQALQVYTRQCFLPTVQAVLDQDVAEHLIEKIRALEVALQQTSRSAKLPHVQLSIHSNLQAVLGGQQQLQMPLDWEALGLADKLSDDDFLNELQAGVSVWIGQIRTLTVLPQSTPLVVQESPEQPPNPDAVAHELAFWTQLSQELTHIQEQLSSLPVEATVSMLREAKRFVATLALENNTGLEQAVTYTNDMLHFLKGFPVTDLQAATDWEQVAAAIQAIFDHFQKLRSSRYYSLQRGVALLEGTTVVLRDVLLHLLHHDKHKNFLFMEYSDYQQKIRYPVLDVFVQFQDRFDEFKDFVLEQGRRRKVTGLTKILEKMTLHHAALRERLDQLDEFRQTQETLREVVHTVLREEEPTALQQVEKAPRQIFSSLNVLDLSQGGKQALESALEEYDLQMDAMEERLARLLRDKLQACQVRAFILRHC